MKMTRRYILCVFVTLMVSYAGASEHDLTLKSPDGRIVVTVINNGGNILYSLEAGGEPLIAPSRLGMLIEGDEDKPALKITGHKAESFDETWRPVCGKRSQVHNQFNELELEVAVKDSSCNPMTIVFRAYDEGVAFRYVLGPEDQTPRQLTVIGELSEINLPDDSSQIWSYAPERRPLGPERISTISGSRKYPLVARVDDDSWLTITEAVLHDFDFFELTFKKEERVAQVNIDRCTITTPFSAPWRVIMFSKDPKTFRDSDLLVNLSPPPKGDFSWVEPGVSLWDWRAWGHQTKDGFTYGLEINSWKRFIDFAHEQGIPYLLLDANWYGPEHSTLSDPFSGGKAAQVKQALEYGNENGVGLILYLNDKASVNFSIEEIVKAYADWGAVGIKYGFMKGSHQKKVRKTERVVRACAKNKLLVNFHDGPIPPTGHERTWPNWNTREFCHAQSDAHRTHSPSDFILMAYVNNIAGPIDGNHGMFDHENSVAQRPKMFTELYSTIVAEVARTLILYSGLTVIPDSADSYKEHPELFSFIAAEKQPWKQSVTIDGSFGEWISVMRQAKDDTYLIATATDELERTVKIPLRFLEPGKKYRATIFQDAKDAHYKTNRSAYEIEHQDVSGTDVIEAHLAPGGGHCIIITAKQ